MSGKLKSRPRGRGRGRRLAALAAEPVIELARTHTTVSVERATWRLAGLSGADPASFSAGEGAGTPPWVNTVVDAVREQVGLEQGVALPVWHALLSGGYADLAALAAKTAAGSVRFALPAGRTPTGPRAARRSAFAAPVRAGDVLEATATLDPGRDRSRGARVRGRGGLPGGPGSVPVGGRRAARAGGRVRARGTVAVP